MEMQFLNLINKIISAFILLALFMNYSSAEGYIKAKEGIEWDSQNQLYTAIGNVEFSNDSFFALADKMIAKYITENNEEVFTKVELFEDIEIKYNDEIFKGDYAIYLKENKTIYLKGNVMIRSPTRILTGDELIVDLEANKRTLNSANDQSLVEVLLENETNN